MNTNLPSKWFIHYRGVVQGPYTSENLPQVLEKLGAENLDQALVWKRGLAEWLKAHQWQKADQKIKIELAQAQQNAKTTSQQSPPPLTKVPPKNNPPPISKNNTQTHVDLFDQTQKTDISTLDQTSTSIEDSELFEKTFTQAFSDNVFYRVQLNFIDQPLMSKNDLMKLISQQEDISAISIQDPKTKEWKEIYAFPDLVEKFGISRRETLRVPILAQFNGNTNKAKNVSYRVITISEGGMGFTENFDLTIGDEVDGQISSPHFFQPLNVKAEVVYAGHDGYIGLKFGTLADEVKSALIEYVKKFGKSTQKP